MIAIDRLDLLALVGLLQREYIACPAARRALNGLESAVESDANTIALLPALNGSVLHVRGEEPALSGGSR